MRPTLLALALCVVAAVATGAEGAPQKHKAFDEEAAKQLHESVGADVTGGFLTEADIVERAVDSLADEDYDPRVLKPVAVSLVKKLLAEHKRTQATWPAVTDCDRLDVAFQELEKAGVVARQNFSDCGTCGAAEIGGEMEQAKKLGRKVRGYTFYHEQDTEGAVGGGGLYLSYGAVADGDAAQVAIGREIAATLKRHGLTVAWDGTLAKRIGVTLDWKRRR